MERGVDPGAPQPSERGRAIAMHTQSSGKSIALTSSRNYGIGGAPASGDLLREGPTHKLGTYSWCGACRLYPFAGAPPPAPRDCNLLTPPRTVQVPDARQGQAPTACEVSSLLACLRVARPELGTRASGVHQAPHADGRLAAMTTQVSRLAACRAAVLNALAARATCLPPVPLLRSPLCALVAGYDAAISFISSLFNNVNFNYCASGNQRPRCWIN